MKSQAATLPGHRDTYRPDIDGLLAIAVLAVVLYHTGGFGVSGGFGGVDVFFVISGYLITTIIQREINDGTFSLLNFYERRIRRIFPALAAVAIVSTAVSAVLLLPEDFKEYGKSLRGLVTFSSNYYFLRATGYFDAAAIEKPLLHTWSLSVEEQFYIVFPVLLFALWRYGRNAANAGIAILAAASFIVSISALEAAPARAFFATPGRVWELFVGVLTALIGPWLTGGRLTRELLAAAGLALIATGFFAYSGATPFPGPAALVFCLGAAFVIYAGSNGGESIVSRVLSAPTLRSIGLVSYSIYLWHWPLIVFAHYRFPHWFSNDIEQSIGMSVALVATSVVLGFLSWRFVEQPFRTRAGTAAQRSAFVAFLSLTAALLLVSVFIIKRHGLPERWPDEVNEMLKRRERPESEVCKPFGQPDIWPKDTCLIGPDTIQPSILVWGDSHAKMMIDSIELAASQSNQSVAVATLGACPPLAGVTLYGWSKSLPCRALAGGVLEAVAKSGVRKVILSARWAYYAEGVSFETSGGRLMQLSADGVDGNPAVVNALFEDTVRRLRALGREVLIIGPVPEHRFYVAPAMVRNLVWDQALPPEVSRTDFAARQRHVLPLLERLDALPGVRVMYPDPYFCDATQCKYAQESKPLYFDANHLSPSGVQRLNPLIAEALASLPGE